MKRILPFSRAEVFGATWGIFAGALTIILFNGIIFPRDGSNTEVEMRAAQTDYIIVYKPSTSKCWTPVDPEEHDRPGKSEWMNWYGSFGRAQADCLSLNKEKRSVFLYGAQKIDTLEFRVATVTVPDLP